MKIGQSSHKMYSNNLLNFQESTKILHACTKKSGNSWRLKKKERKKKERNKKADTLLVYIYIYIYMCVCVRVYVCVCVYFHTYIGNDSDIYEEIVLAR